MQVGEKREKSRRKEVYTFIYCPMEEATRSAKDREPQLRPFIKSSREQVDVDQVVCGGSRLKVVWPTVSKEELNTCSQEPRGGWSRWKGRPRYLGGGARVNLLFFLHGRQGNSSDASYDRALELAANLPVVCVWGDLPNHGERTLESARNMAWKQGNSTHAADMYSQMCTSVREIQVS